MSMKNVRQHQISKGLDLPIEGGVPTTEEAGPKVQRVALVADDYVGMRPKMFVKEGDAVSRGQVLFEDRKNPGVLFTSPGGGIVEGVLRGEHRALRAVVIRLDGEEKDHSFAAYAGLRPEDMSSQAMEALMLESGMWTALRTRPFSRSPQPGTRPEALFVTAMDTEPLAADPDTFLATRGNAFVAGIKGLVSLAGGSPVHLCRKPGSSIPGGDVPGVEVHEFGGPHPAGTAGMHIHLVAPVTAQKEAWHIGYQDVWALGQLLLTGKLCVERVVSLSGPAVKAPVLWKTRLGAEVAPLVSGRLKDGESRVISGSALYGRKVEDPVGFLGRFHRQLAVLPEDRSRPFLGWMAPGGDRYSILPLFLGWFTLRGKKLAFSTRTHGSQRAVVPFGAFEKVFPFETHAVFLLRALLGGDLPLAQELGVLELDEEDLALCTFACPGKNDYGQALREVLTTIEKEG